MKEKRVFKKLVGILLVGVLVMSTLVGCGGTTGETETTGSVDETLMKELSDAMAKLQAKDKYVINNQLSAPDGTTNFLEVVTSGDSYTEYMIDNSNTEDADSNGEAKDYQYSLQDWCSLDGSAYIYVGDKWYKFPDGYGKELGSRKIMYADKIIPKLTSLRKEKDTEKADVGDGEETFTIYTGQCPAEVAQEVLGMTTTKVYDTLVNTYKDDEKYKDEVHLANLYLEDLKKTMTMSDATVEFAVCDGILRELNITVGGIGTKMKYYRAVSFKAKYQDETKPSTLSADNIPSIIDTLTESASFAKDYDNYDDMAVAYQKKVEKEQAVQQEALDKQEKQEKQDKEKDTKSTPAPKEKEDKDTKESDK